MIEFVSNIYDGHFIDNEVWMYKSVEIFLRELDALKQDRFPGASLEIVYSRFNKVSLRLLIDVAFFIDMYFNAENGRSDFSLMWAGKRVFGYDNLTQWHCHPVDNPSLHVTCNQPTLRQILEEMAATIQ